MTVPELSLRLPRQTMRSLAHLPHCGHAPVLSDIRFLRDTLGFTRQVFQRCGPVSRVMLFARPQLLLLSAEANERVLFDRDETFSARGGWKPLLGDLFPGGLILRDGQDHRRHRRLMLPAFRREELARHLARMTPTIDATVERWLQHGQVEFYAAVKRLTLDLATDVFLGVRLKAEIDAVDHDFMDLVQASAAILRLPLPGTTYARGIKARARLVRFLSERMAARRHGDGDDLFSQLCRQQREAGDTETGGGGYTDAELVDHMIFLLMAAHDTITSALATVMLALAQNPQWQDRLAGEIDASEAARDGCAAPTLDSLGRLDLAGQTLREALRLYPPLPTIARMAVRDCELHGCRIPAGTPVTVAPLFVQRDERWWSDPDRFDPERFSPERAEHRRHAFAWTPFGGGAHMCLGMNFAELQVKAVLRALLARGRWQLGTGFRDSYAYIPIGRPRGGLPIRFVPLEASSRCLGVATAGQQHSAP